MRNLISEKFTVTCELFNFDYANYFENNFLSMFITPKHLMLNACGMPSGDFVIIPLEGYRTQSTSKITQNPTPPKKQKGGRG